MDGQITIFNFLQVAALWKYDFDLGIAFCCPKCKRFICSSGNCRCGINIDLDKPKKRYNGKMLFD